MVSKAVAEHCSSWSFKILGFLEFEWRWFIKKKEFLLIFKLVDVRIGNRFRKKAHGMSTETSYLKANFYLGFYAATAVWYLHFPELYISSENPHHDLLHPDLFVYKYSKSRGEAETTVWDCLQSRTSLYFFASFYNQVLLEWAVWECLWYRHRDIKLSVQLLSL